MLFIHRYNPGSASARALRDGLDARFIRTENSRFRGGLNKIVVNWGDSSLTNPEILNSIVINHPQRVAAATNKRDFFQMCKGNLNIPDFTFERSEAEGWIRDGKKVVVREKLTGHSGEGIVLLEDLLSWDNYNHSRAKMYVLYIPKMEEYRVHVFGNEVVDIQQKRIRSDFPSNSVNHQIRNHQNGFVYTRGNVNPHPQVSEQAIAAIGLTGLDFGAVDVIWNRHRQTAYVLEVNTAPGLEGQTVQTYIEALNNLEQTIREMSTADVSEYQRQLMADLGRINVTTNGEPTTPMPRPVWANAISGRYIRRRAEEETITFNTTTDWDTESF